MLVFDLDWVIISYKILKKYKRLHGHVKAFVPGPSQMEN